jgi:transposase
VSCSCGTSFDGGPGTRLERRQVFEPPEPRLAVTEYQRFRCQCRVCGKTPDGLGPHHVQAPTQDGARGRALATLLHTPCTLPFRKIRRLFADLFGDAINEQTLVTANTRCDIALAPSEAVIKTHLRASPVCHFDETGLRVDGRLPWQHPASTASATDLFGHPQRGQQALDSKASLVPAYQGGHPRLLAELFSVFHLPPCPLWGASAPRVNRLDRTRQPVGKTDAYISAHALPEHGARNSVGRPCPPVECPL